MSDLKIAVLIADSYGEPFETIKTNIQPRLWNSLPGVDVFYMRGCKPNALQASLNTFTDRLRYKKFWPIQRIFDQLQLSLISTKRREVTARDRDLIINIPEGLRYLGLKLILSLNYLHKQNYDVVYKTTLSSIVNPKLFMNLVSQIDHSEPFYAGTPINFGSRPFVSGANLMLNRNAVGIILNSLNKWNHGLLDDVAVGRILEGKTKIHPVSSINFSTVSQSISCSTEVIKRTMHFRCKSSASERDDVAIMSEVIRRISNEF